MSYEALTPIFYLPMFARLAIERVDADSALRDGDKLDELLTAYATSYRMELDQQTRDSAHRICARRFWNFKPRAADVAAHALTLLIELGAILGRSYGPEQFDSSTHALLAKAETATRERWPDMLSILCELADYLTRHYDADRFDGTTHALLEQACALTDTPYFARAA